jgi:hypothetical protein
MGNQAEVHACAGCKIILACSYLQVPVPEAVLGITWAGKSLLLAVPGGYQVLHPVMTHAPNHQQQQQATGYQLVVLADHLASIQPLLGCIPEQGLALMLWEENMVLVTDASGVCGVEGAVACS